jgi:hypothetical protein
MRRRQTNEDDRAEEEGVGEVVARDMLPSFKILESAEMRTSSADPNRGGCDA